MKNKTQRGLSADLDQLFIILIHLTWNQNNFSPHKTMKDVDNIQRKELNVKKKSLVLLPVQLARYVWHVH